MLRRTLARQLSAPDGILAQMAGRYRDRVNAPVHTAVLAALDPAPGERVLTVGLSGGQPLQELVARVAPASVTAVEPSRPMIEQARHRYGALLAARRLELTRGTGERLPMSDRHFDCACSVDTIYAWRSPAAGLVEIRRVLRPGGRLVLAFHPWEALHRRRESGNARIRLYAREARQLMESAGYRNVRLQLHGPETWPFACAIGERAPG